MKTVTYTIEPYPHSRLLPRVDDEYYDAAISMNENGGVRALLLCSSRRAPRIKRALEALDAGEGPLPFTQDKEVWAALRQGIQELKQGASEEISEAVQGVKEQVVRPSVMYRAQLTEFDGQFRAQYGAFAGDYKATPEEAMLDFDRKWCGAGKSAQKNRPLSLAEAVAGCPTCQRLPCICYAER